jgi:uncharacterized protein Usg
MRRGIRRDPKAIEMQLKGYRLSTAEILYWMPDHPSVLQSFVWQHYDRPPEFPELHRFLGFWKDNIDATLHTVRVACADAIKAPSMRTAQAVYQIHGAAS